MGLMNFMRNRMPEAIPAPGAIIYNAIPARILRTPETKIAKDVVSKVTKGAVVDLGAGPGYLAIEIAKMGPALKVYVIDLSKEMVKIARRHGHGITNVHFEVGNAAELPFENESIDFIVSTGSLHHWKKPAKVFDECYRILKSGKEAWIYDGCSGLSKEQAGQRIRKYDLLRYKILSRLQKLHGFTLEEYRTTIIKGILDETAFKDNYEMELTDIWMKITLKKMKGPRGSDCHI
jgi:ubiquinone/menaquinone biosynthesis C-methylase UbiE